MRLISLLAVSFIFLTVVPIQGFAQSMPEDSYEILDGPTAPEQANNAPVSPMANAPASAPQATEDGGGIEYDIVASKPPCTNSTCITQQSIANANHDYVYTSPVKSYISLLNAPDGEEQACQEPVPTGMTVYRQVVEGGNGRVVQVLDAFCLNQGCVYFGGIGQERCE